MNETWCREERVHFSACVEHRYVTGDVTSLARVRIDVAYIESWFSWDKNLLPYRQTGVAVRQWMASLTEPFSSIFEEL